MRQLRIGIMGARGIPNQYGGFEQFAQYLSLGLTQRGHQVWVYASHNLSYRQKVWNGVKLVHCYNPEHLLGTAGQFFYDLNCIRDARKRDFDILLHLGYTSDAIWHWHWPKKAVHLMNMDGLEWKRSKYNRSVRRFLRWMEALAVRKAQVLIADSSRIQEYLEATYHKEAVYIPYAAMVFTDVDPSVLPQYRLQPGKYFLLVARMEPENNIEMIIRGYLASAYPDPLFIIGNISNRFGKYLRNTYQYPGIRFGGPVYDPFELNNLRYHASLYFHGHSVGGTNPSLLEAMGCGCNIAAHDNEFNQAVLGTDAVYFSTPDDIARIITTPSDPVVIYQHKLANLEKIRTIYSLEKNISDYEQLMQNSYRNYAYRTGEKQG